MRREIIPTIDVNEKTAMQFIKSVSKGIEELDNYYLKSAYLLNRNSITISFDRNFAPFLGFTPGYNLPENRPVFLKDSIIITRAAELLESWDFFIPGGRLFFNRDHIFRHSNNRNIVLCHFAWRGIDPFEAIKEFFYKTCAQRNQTNEESLQKILDLLQNWKY